MTFDVTLCFSASPRDVMNYINYCGDGKKKSRGLVTPAAFVLSFFSD